MNYFVVSLGRPGPHYISANLLDIKGPITLQLSVLVEQRIKFKK